MLKTEFGEPVYTNGFMVQRVDIIDESTGLKWRGSARLLLEEEIPLSPNSIIDHIRKAVIDARRGVCVNRVYRFNQYLLYIRLTSNEDSFLNASNVEINLFKENKVLYNVRLYPYL